MGDDILNFNKCKLAHAQKAGKPRNNKNYFLKNTESHNNNNNNNILIKIECITLYKQCLVISLVPMGILNVVI